MTSSTWTPGPASRRSRSKAIACASTWDLRSSSRPRFRSGSRGPARTHCTPSANSAPVTTLGPRLEEHPAFPNRANIEFVTINSPDRIAMRVWERGSRETLACGTGACAGAVAARLLRGTDAKVTVGLRGGDLEIEWAGSTIDERPVFMTGTAAEVFTGEIGL